MLAGGCLCGSLRYETRAPPLFVHVCHCFEEMYALDQVWSPESLARFRILGS